MRTSAAHLVVIVPFITACAHPSQHQQDVPASLSSRDARRALFGTWQLSVGPDTLIHTDSAVWKTGTFRITDSLISRSGQEVKAALTPPFGDLANLAGGSWALNGPLPVGLGGTAVALQHRKGTWDIDLTPNLFDVSFGLNGELRGDSLVGHWYQYVMGGLARSGRFVMRRTSKSR